MLEKFRRWVWPRKVDARFYGPPRLNDGGSRHAGRGVRALPQGGAHPHVHARALRELLPPGCTSGEKVEFFDAEGRYQETVIIHPDGREVIYNKLIYRKHLTVHHVFPHN